MDDVYVGLASFHSKKGVVTMFNYIIFVVFVAIGLWAFFWVTYPILTENFGYKNEQKKKSKSSKKNNTAFLVQEFLKSSSSNDLGNMFVSLTKCGFFTSLKTSNHGKKFNDRKQLADFKKFTNTETVNALRKVGESYERYCD